MFKHVSVKVTPRKNEAKLEIPTSGFTKSFRIFLGKKSLKNLLKDILKRFVNPDLVSLTLFQRVAA
jgi:hypothetical protein